MTDISYAGDTVSVNETSYDRARKRKKKEEEGRRRSKRCECKTRTRPPNQMCRKEKRCLVTMVFVTEVPMFAPIMIGIAPRTDNTSAPTKPMTMFVLVDEDCTKTVAKMPTMRAVMGWSEKVNRFPAPLLPSALKEPPIRSRPKRKK